MEAHGRSVAGLELEMSRTFTIMLRRKRDAAIDMVGQARGDYRVVRRAPAVNGAARFYCECIAGHGRYFDGWYLRRATPRCAECTQRLRTAV